ncbi:MAG: AzlD domain-containing protein [Pseudomonadota bacterium]
MTDPFIHAALLAIAGAAIATYFWRGLGVLLAGRLPADSPAVAWIACIAYAMLAGLISRMILLPIGPLATTTLGARIAATIIALALFYLTRRNLIAGVAAGGAALVLLSQAGA